MASGLALLVAAAGISYGCSSRAAQSETPTHPQLHDTVQNDGASPDSSFPDLGADRAYRTDHSTPDAGVPDARPDYGLPVQPDSGPEPDSGLERCIDADRDGFYSVENCGTGIDCDDTSMLRWQTIFAHVDNDNDGYGNEDLAEICAGKALPDGYALNDLDCDDTSNSIHPGAFDLCDGLDNDCDIITPDGSGEIPSLNVLQAGVCSGSRQACAEGSWQNSYVGVAGHQTTETSCDGLNNDCDDDIDEGLLSRWYGDADRDGYGDASTYLASCSAADGYVSNDEDCDDTENSINPAAAELCDLFDNNCNEEIDELLDCRACPLSENTVGYWNFDEESGTIAYDVSGNELAGTLSDATARGAGVYNRGLSLDGLDDLVRVPANPLLNVREFTITHWIRRNADRQARIACRHDDGRSDVGYATEISPDGKFTVIIGGYAYASTSSIPLYEWAHLAATLKEEGQLKMYRNGEFDAEHTLTVPIRPDSSLDLVMGRQANNAGANYFQGNLDEVKIYSCVLSDTQIRNDYEGD